MNRSAVKFIKPHLGLALLALTIGSCSLAANGDESLSVPTKAFCQSPELSWALSVDLENSQISVLHEAKIEASYPVIFQKISQFPEVDFDHYRTVYGEERSNFILSLPRFRRGSVGTQVSHAFLIAGGVTQALSCTVNFRKKEDFEKAMDEDLIRAQKAAQISPGEFPPQVCALEYLNEDTSEYEFGCSATLIGPRDLLTASHCQMIYTDREVRARCPGQPPVPVDLENSVRHEFHIKDMWRVGYDVAVLRLGQPIDTPPLKIAQSVAEARDLLFDPVYSHCQMFGYGQQIHGEEIIPAKTLGTPHGAQFNFPPKELGGRTFSENNFEDEGMISSDPRLFLRAGDSGGPILCRNQAGENVVVGVHSILLALDSSASSCSVGANAAWIKSKLFKADLLNPSETPSLQPADNHD